MAEIDYNGKVSQAIAQITAAVTNASLYSFTHPQVGQYIEKAHSALSSVLQSRPEVTTLLIGDDLIVENQPLPATSAFVANFIRILRRKAVERLTFVSGLPKEDLQEFIKDLAATGTGTVRSRPCIKLGKVELRVRQHGGRGGAAIPASSPGVEAVQAAGVAPEAVEELSSLTSTELDELQELYLRIKKHRQINVRGIEDLVKGFIKGFRREINPLGILASLKSSHEYTFTHVTNVGILTMSQAESLGFRGEHLHQIGVASLLHDVGKLFIPEEILNKPGKLSQDERKIIETHTVKGARYLMGLDGIPKLAVLAALEHHLKYDGSGYPTIRTGWKPSIVSQIISVADVFDAMRSNRSYQGGQSMEQIVGVLQKGRGSSFNPQLVDHFLKLIRYKAP